jgi:hypothetical protein
VPIPPSHKGRYAYHFTHIDNLPNLLRTGFLAKNHPSFPKSLTEKELSDLSGL